MIVRLISSFISIHPAEALALWAGIQWAWSVFVDCLEPPVPMGNPYYRLFYKFAHGLAGNKSEAQKKF